jgi:hypothetical protein
MTAFVARREQVVALSQQSNIESVETSAAFDYVCFSATGSRHGYCILFIAPLCNSPSSLTVSRCEFSAVHVVLKFDLTRTRPSEAEINFKAPPKKRGKSKAERAYPQTHIPDYVHAITIALCCSKE